MQKETRDRQGGNNNQSLVAQYSTPYDENANNLKTRAQDTAQLLTVDDDLNTCSTDGWFADSGAIEHMSFDKKLFKNFISYSENTYKVRVGGGNLINTRGRGDIDIVTKATNGNKIYTMSDVLFVPKIEKNLISIAKSTKKGIRVIFEESGKRVLLKRMAT